jgi:Spy/CpxP family protein refolding chaperone
MANKRKSLLFNLIIALVFTMVSFGAAAANACGRGQGTCGMAGGMGGPGGRGFGWFGNNGANGPGGGLAQYLGLSTKQQQQMHDLQFAFMKKTLDTRDELGKKRIEQKALLNSDPVEWKKVDQLTDEVAKLQATMEKEKARQRSEMKKILTPEQLEKFKSKSCPQGLGGNGTAAGGPGCAMGSGPGNGPGCGMAKGGMSL